MFELLKEGLEEVLEYHRGNIKLRKKEVFIPDSPKPYPAKDIKKLRDRLGLTQDGLAKWLNISLNTVQSWEQGTRKPNHASLRLLELLDKNFSFVEKICKSEYKPKENKQKINTTNYVERNYRTPIAAKSRH